MIDQAQTEEKIRLLKNVPLFSNLDDRELAVVAGNSQFVHFEMGTLIFSEGATSDELYVVKDGVVLITKRREERNDMDLAQFIGGESFGELELIGNVRRSATAVAIRDTTLLVFPKEGISFSMVLNKHARVSARLLLKLLVIVSKRLRETHILIKEKSPWIQQLQRQVYVDKLTGLYNRTYLEEEFKRLLPEYGEHTALIFIKPDNFKELNDNYGHEAGDTVLILMAIFVQSILRDNDYAVRYRGDEYAVVLPDTSREQAIRIAREASAAITDIALGEVTGSEDYKIRVSIGISLYPEHAPDSTALIRSSFEKMMKARNGGGNRIIVQK